MRIALGILLGVLVTTVEASAQETFPLRLARNAGFHIPLALGEKTIRVRMAQDEHFVFMVEDALRDLGKLQDILVLESQGFRNGVAMMWTNFSGKKVKVLVYDPAEIYRDRVHSKRNWGSAVFTIAHEIGHHVCGHIAAGGGSSPSREIEADTVAGRILRHSVWRDFFGDTSFEEIEQIMRWTLSPDASSTHPGVTQRLEAFRAGWNGAAICRDAALPPSKEERQENKQRVVAAAKNECQNNAAFFCNAINGADDAGRLRALFAYHNTRAACQRAEISLAEHKFGPVQPSGLNSIAYPGVECRGQRARLLPE